MTHPATVYEPRLIVDPHRRPSWLPPRVPHARLEVQPRCALCHTPVHSERHYCPTCTLDMFARPTTLARRLSKARITPPAPGTITVRVKRTPRRPARPAPGPRGPRRRVERRVWRMAWRGLRRLWR